MEKIKTNFFREISTPFLVHPQGLSVGFLDVLPMFTNDQKEKLAMMICIIFLVTFHNKLPGKVRISLSPFSLSSAAVLIPTSGSSSSSLPEFISKGVRGL